MRTVTFRRPREVSEASDPATYRLAALERSVNRQYDRDKRRTGVRKSVLMVYCLVALVLGICAGAIIAERNAPSGISTGPVMLELNNVWYSCALQSVNTGSCTPAKGTGP